MPSIPLLGPGGNLSDLVLTDAHNALTRAVDNTAALIPYDASYLGQSHHVLNRVSGLANASSVNASAILALDQRHSVQIMATCASSISLAAAVVALYWFVLMKRNFRRDLVLLLIVGGSWKSLWFLIFPVVNFARGPVTTPTAFCEVSGYMLQMGFEACDFAILFMSMHMSLQIFPPSHSFLGHEGLYRIRHWVLGIWIALPNLSAGLAFVNPRDGFVAQGGFCSMPFRPIWYRLALFWVPRYMIWIYVFFVAVRIYRHVGSEFKVFGGERDRSSSFGMPGQSSIDPRAQAEQERAQENRSMFDDQEETEKPTARNDEEFAPDEVSSVSKTNSAKIPPHESQKSIPSDGLRRQSTPNWVAKVNSFGVDSSVALPASRSNPGSRRNSRQIAIGVLADDFTLPPDIEPGRHRGSIATLASIRSSIAAEVDASSALAPIREIQNSASTASSKPQDTANAVMRQRRRAIQRQLRLLFIYPCVYMMLWVIPFIVHCMNYTDYWAQHPIFPLQILQVFSLGIMTFCDVVVFCWRERPWRHIPGSDGTVLGSFMWWRYRNDWAHRRKESRAQTFMLSNEKLADGDKRQLQTGLMSSLKRWPVSRIRSSPYGSEGSAAPSSARAVPPHTRTFSGGSDKKHMEAERAHERLTLERAEYEQNRRSLQERRASVISQVQQASPGKREWFDQQDKDLFRDHGLKEDERAEKI